MENTANFNQNQNKNIYFLKSKNNNNGNNEMQFDYDTQKKNKNNLQDKNNQSENISKINQNVIKGLFYIFFLIIFF